MNENLKQYIHKSIDFNQPLLLCVSGGKDSACLLHLVMEYISEFRNPPEVIHFNHGLRKKSKNEQEFVKRLCDKYNLLLKVFNLKVKEYALREKFSIEEAARLLRYKNLGDYSSFKGGKGYIFTAHTASDQLETIIFRLIKGTGLSGLVGIRKEMKLSSGWIVRRPLLCAGTGEIKKYIKENNIRFCTDRSNFNINIPRNFIRHRIIKYLKKLNPSIEKNVAKEVSIWSQEEDYLRQEVNNAVSKVSIDRRDGKIYIELKKILSYNEWLQRRIFKLLSPVDLDYNKTDAVVKLIDKNGSSRYIEIGGGWKARKEYDFLIFERVIPELRRFEYSVIPGRDIHIKEIEKTVRANLIKNYIGPVKAENVEIFDADELNLDDIKVRSKTEGDRITLFGGGTKKIKDLCIDLKLPLNQRNTVAVFDERDRVLWVAPYRRSDIAPVTENTKMVLKLEIT